MSFPSGYAFPYIHYGVTMKDIASAKMITHNQLALAKPWKLFNGVLQTGVSSEMPVACSS
jgi:hypothetical protein